MISRRAAAAPPRWACLHLPDFDLQLLLARHPDWKDRPVVLLEQAEGGRFCRVLAASATALARGVRPGQERDDARSLCPQAGWWTPDPRHRAEAAGVLARIAETSTPEFEVDEARGEVLFNLAGTEKVLGADLSSWAKRLGDEVRTLLGIEDLQVVIATTRSAARLLARHVRQTPLHVCSPGAEAAALGPIPLLLCNDLPVSARRVLERLGIATLGDVRRCSRGFLRAHLGAGTGERLLAQAQGLDIDGKGARSPGRLRSLAVEEVLARDSNDAAFLRARVHDLADRLAFRLREEGLAVSRLHIELSWADGQPEALACDLPKPEQAFLPLHAHALELLSRLLRRRVAVRSLRLEGCRADTDPRQVDLFEDEGRRRQQRLQGSIDRVRQRRGYGSIVNAVALAGP